MHTFSLKRIATAVVMLWLFVLALGLVSCAAHASNEIKATNTSGTTNYCVILNASAQVYNQNSSAFETLVAAGANWTTTKECIAMARPGTSTTSQLYVASMPTTGTPAGRYSYIVFQQAGANPAESDTIIAQGVFDWNGSAIASIGTHTGTDGKTLLSANAQAGVTIPTVTNITNAVTVSPTDANVAAAVWSALTSGYAGSGSFGARVGLMYTILSNFQFDGSNFVKSNVQAVTSGATAPAGFFATGSAPASGWYANQPNATIGGYATNEDPATLVLGATAASWNTAGTIGNKINSGGGGGGSDPWATLLTSETTAGSFGAALKAFMVASPSGWLASDSVSINAIVGGVFAHQVEATVTLQQAMEIIAAYCGGNVNTGNHTYSGINTPGTVRISYILDAFGNRNFSISP